METPQQATTPAQQGPPQGPSQAPYRRNYFIALALSVVVGMFGIDRFYMGKIGTGILKLITGGGFLIWWIVDIVLIASGQMLDKQGRPMTRTFDLPD